MQGPILCTLRWEGKHLNIMGITCTCIGLCYQMLHFQRKTGFSLVCFFLVISSSPSLDCIEELQLKLRETNNFSAFIANIRKAFIALSYKWCFETVVNLSLYWFLIFTGGNKDLYWIEQENFICVIVKIQLGVGHGHVGYGNHLRLPLTIQVLDLHIWTGAVLKLQASFVPCTHRPPFLHESQTDFQDGERNGKFQFFPSCNKLCEVG